MFLILEKLLIPVKFDIINRIINITMKTISFILPAFFVLIVSLSVTAQVKVANNTDLISPAHASSALEVFSTTKGFLPPRLTTAQRDAIASPAAGLTIYNTSTNCLNTYDSGVWRSYCEIDRDHDFYTIGTSLPPTAITQNQYTYGSISYGNTALQNKATGANSLAGGANCVASGGQSFSFGNINDVSGSNSMAGGVSNLVSGSHSIVSGNDNEQRGGVNSLIVGTRNLSTSSQNIVTGADVTVNGVNNIACGSNNTVTLHRNIAGGINNVVSNHNNLVVGSTNNANAASSIVSGANNTITGGAHCNMITGTFHNIAGNLSCISGSNNRLTTGAAGPGHANVISGANNIVAGRFNLVGGLNNNIATTNPAATGQINLVVGLRNQLSDSDGNLVAGADNTLNPGADYSIVAGRNNVTSREHSFAIGYNNTVNHNNSWAIGGTAAGGVASTSNQQFNAHFISGYRLFSNQAMTTGVRLNANTSGWAAVSDRRAKKNVEELAYGLQQILALKPLQYEYKTSDKTSLGFIAQEVQTILPELVDVPEGKEDYLSIRYTELIPILTKAIQEQQAVIESLKEDLSATTEELNELKASNSRLDRLEVELAELKELLR